MKLNNAEQTHLALFVLFILFILFIFVGSIYKLRIPFGPGPGWGEDEAINTPLMDAVAHHNIPQIKQCVEDKSYINERRGENKKTALHLATTVVEAKLILENGADPNLQDINGKTPLYYAVHDRNYDIISILIKYHANPRIQDKQGISPLKLAQNWGDSRAERILRKQKTL